MRQFLSLLLGLVLAFATNARTEITPYVAHLSGAPSAAVYERVKAAVWPVYLYGNTKCTLVARGPQVVQFAQHCLRGKWPTQLQIGEHDVKVERIALDGHDHVLIRVSGFTFIQWANLATERPKQGDWVFIYGAPRYFTDLLRFGTFAGQEQDAILYDLRTDHGDSGGAIFNARGEILDIVYGSPGGMDWLTLCFPIAFGRSQLAWVGLA